MDIHSIKSDLIAMEMELNYHDIDDDYEFDFEDMANSKTPKTSHATPKLVDSSQIDEDDEKDSKRPKHNIKKVSNYVSLALIEKTTQNLKNVEKNQCEDRMKQSKGTKRNVIKFNKVVRRSMHSTSTLTKTVDANVNGVDTKMISFPSLQNLNGCNPIFSIEDDEDDYFFVMNSIVRVTIKLSNRKNYEFSQQGHMVIAREEEMKHIAKMMHLDWNGSLIMQSVLKKKGSAHRNDQTVGRSKEISIVLEPESGLESSSITWSPTLRKSIERFYNSGVISVFDNCPGRELILALKFMKIVYTPTHLTFESFGTYLKFKLWSDYISYRKGIADWVKKNLMYNHSQHRYTFATHPETLKNTSFYFRGQKCQQLDGELQLWNDDSNQNAEVPSSCRVVHDLFAGGHNAQDTAKVSSSSKHSHPLREDFKSYLQKELPGTIVSFSLHKVTIHSLSSSISNSHSMIRPVLCIELREKRQFKSLRYQELPPTTEQISLFNHQDVSSLSDQNSLFEDEEQMEEEYKSPPKRAHITVDALNAEWLYSVFLCKTSTDYSTYRR